MQTPKATIINATAKHGTRTAGSEYIFHIPPKATGGIGFYEGYFKIPGTNKSLHYHKKMTEIFTVLEGEFYFTIDGEEYVFGANDSAIIPPGVIHGFRAKLPGSRLQFIFTEIIDREGFFEGIARIANGEWTPNENELETFYNRYDQYTVK
jgi:mannose-6-phosphate isomerase-like protein (cupin superfamily)